MRTKELINNLKTCSEQLKNSKNTDTDQVANLLILASEELDRTELIMRDTITTSIELQKEYEKQTSLARLVQKKLKIISQRTERILRIEEKNHNSYNLLEKDLQITKLSREKVAAIKELSRIDNLVSNDIIPLLEEKLRPVDKELYMDVLDIITRVVDWTYSSEWNSKRKDLN